MEIKSIGRIGHTVTTQKNRPGASVSQLFHNVFDKILCVSLCLRGEEWLTTKNG